MHERDSEQVRNDVCHLYSLSSDLLPQIRATKAALLLYPRVVLHSRALAIIHKDLHRQGAEAARASSPGRDLIFMSPGFILGRLPTGLSAAFVFLGQAIKYPRSEPQLFNVFASREEYEPILSAFRFAPDEETTQAAVKPHNEMVTFAMSGQRSLSLAAPHLGELLSASGEGRGINADLDAARLIDGLSNSESLRDEVREMAGEPLEV